METRDMKGIKQALIGLLTSARLPAFQHIVRGSTEVFNQRCSVCVCVGVGWGGSWCSLCHSVHTASEMEKWSFPQKLAMSSYFTLADGKVMQLDRNLSYDEHHTHTWDSINTCTQVLQHICSVFHKMEMYEKGFEGKSAKSRPIWVTASTYIQVGREIDGDRNTSVHRFVYNLNVNELYSRKVLFKL